MSAGRHISLVEQAYREYGAGGFSRWDGTVAFMTRVNALIGPESTVLDLGAGRGEIHSYPVPFIRRLADLKSRAARVIGLDVDPAVADNPGLDLAHPEQWAAQAEKAIADTMIAGDGGRAKAYAAAGLSQTPGSYGA